MALAEAIEKTEHIFTKNNAMDVLLAEQLL